MRNAELAVRALRDAADEAAYEVLWHLEQYGAVPASILDHAEELLRAVGEIEEPVTPPRGEPLR
jgi:hypothetical protein